MLTGREFSRRELEDKLVKKGCAADIAAQVVNGLEAERLLSDDRFVETLVYARRRRGYGPLRIRRELQDKGISEETIERWLDAGGAEWFEEVRRVRRRKYGARVPKSLAERAKQSRFLQYRGFSFDQIQQALNSREQE
jgi:regulatory protein